MSWWLIDSPFFLGPAKYPKKKNRGRVSKLPVHSESQPSTKPTKLSTAGTLEKWVATVQSALAHLSSALASVQFFGRTASC